MVPKVAGKGKSFKGAGQYYLHDKKASTADRVAFTLTRNLPTDDPEFAIRLMAHTAMHQAQLKAAHGAVATGRKLVHSVYCYSLSWAPDENPTQQEMLDAALETIEALGIGQHEALLVSHNDEPHPHIHVIVNRVHPQTGLAAKLACDHLTLSRWAEDYERRQGEIRCEERVENNRLRRQLKAAADKAFVKHTPRLNTAEFHAWRKARLKEAFDRRQMEEKNLSASHKGEREVLFDEKEARIAWRREQIREANRPQWSQLYKQQWREKHELNQMQRTAYSRLRYYIKQHGLTGARFSGLVKAVLGRDNPHAELSRKHEAERRALAKDVRAQNHEVIRQENAVFRKELDHLKALQAKDKWSLQQAHSRESQALAREIKAKSDEMRSDRLTDEFTKRVRDRIRKARKRGERGKGKGQGRERE